MLGLVPIVPDKAGERCSHFILTVIVFKTLDISHQLTAKNGGCMDIGNEAAVHKMSK